jgi:hypothetical protein
MFIAMLCSIKPVSPHTLRHKPSVIVKDGRQTHHLSKDTVNGGLTSIQPTGCKDSTFGYHIGGEGRRIHVMMHCHASNRNRNREYLVKSRSNVEEFGDLYICVLNWE